MDSIKRWLDKNNLGYEIWNMTEGDNAIVVNHDYVGLYPTKDAMDTHRKISNYIKIYKKDYFTSARGNYNCTLIRKK